MLLERLTKVALLGSSWVLYLLLALSVLSFAVIIERVLFFRRNRSSGTSLRRALEERLARGEVAPVTKLLETEPSIEARVLRQGLAWRAGGPEAVQEAIQSALGAERAGLERGVAWLGTVGNNAPFVGLFGTVIGVIEAFHHLGAQGAKGGAMGNVMLGISEALVATGVGIFVAIPAVVAFNVVQKQIERIEGDTLALGKLLSAWVRTLEAPRNVAAAGGE
jgi:biopolymer transport protein ExbB/TolQ